MRNIFYTAAIAICTTVGVQAQDTMQNKVQETTTARTTVKTSLGNETVIKKTTKTNVTDYKLDPAQAGQENQNLIAENATVRTKTTYTFDNADFMLEETVKGFNVIQTTEDSNTQVATLRKLARGDIYMMKDTNGISVSYFDKEGNLVRENYNDDNDSMTIITYKVKTPMAVKSEKMRK